MRKRPGQHCSNVYQMLISRNLRHICLKCCRRCQTDEKRDIPRFQQTNVKIFQLFCKFSYRWRFYSFISVPKRPGNRLSTAQR